MANVSQTTKDNFIKTIAPIIQKYAKQYGYKYASPIIAQACLESAYGTSWISKSPYFNFFGLKCGSKWSGRSVSAKTKEEYTKGTLTTIKDNFRAYNSIEEGVEGYFKFIATSRYANLKTATSPKNYLELIKADGYATSSTYVKSNFNLIEKLNLTQYDTTNTVTVNTVATNGNYYPKYTGASTQIDVVLQGAQVENKYRGSYKARKPIAEANGIKNYKGSATQNIALIKLAKSGLLKRPV